ncbi:MAG TPA: recombinase A [bacterium]|nr:recombinase A [bacterium]
MSTLSAARSIQLASPEGLRQLQGSLPGGRPAQKVARAEWSYAACSGRLIEVSGSARSAVLSLAFALVRDAQGQGEPVAWITGPDGMFFPPDVAGCGVDAAALVVVRLPEMRAAARVADRLLRSGGFGVTVLDFISAATRERSFIPAPYQGRLVQLAQRQDASVVCLTAQPEAWPSLSSMVSLRAIAERGKPGKMQVPATLRVVKDKLHGANWQHREVYRAPDGMC